jgi:hypothetical protein
MQLPTHERLGIAYAPDRADLCDAIDATSKCSNCPRAGQPTRSPQAAISAIRSDAPDNGIVRRLRSRCSREQVSPPP